MTIQNNFNRRKEDIEQSFNLLSFILKIEPHKNKPIVDSVSGAELIVTQEMQCTFKAQFLIVLYNIVESTVCDCLNTIYDTIADEGLKYLELTDSMRQMWKNYMKRKSHPLKDADDDTLMSELIRFEALAINISGSLDIRKIIEVFSKHGCTVDESNRERYAESFLCVKTCRNKLAHGNIAFSTCGSTYLLSDLVKFKNDIISYLEVVVRDTGVFIEHRMYKRSI